MFNDDLSQPESLIETLQARSGRAMTTDLALDPDGASGLTAAVTSAARSLHPHARPPTHLASTEVAQALADVVEVATSQVSAVEQLLQQHAAAGRRAVTLHEQIDRLLAGQATAQRDRIAP